MKRIIIVLLLLTLQSVWAQEPVDTAFISKLKEEGLNRSQVMEIASMLTDVYVRVSQLKAISESKRVGKSTISRNGV